MGKVVVSCGLIEKVVEIDVEYTDVVSIVVAFDSEDVIVSSVNKVAAVVVKFISADDKVVSTKSMVDDKEAGIVFE